MQYHRWVLDSGQPRSAEDLRAHFESEREHHIKTVLVAGKDPRSPQQVLMHNGWEKVVAHMNRGIAAAMATLEGETRTVTATVRGTLRVPEMADQWNTTPDGDDRGRYHGEELSIAVTVARRIVLTDEDTL